MLIYVQIHYSRGYMANTKLFIVYMPIYALSFLMLLSVPGFRVLWSAPGTVTTPFFVGWWNWRWLPVWPTWNQPSFFSFWTMSRTVVGILCGYRTPLGEWFSFDQERRERVRLSTSTLPSPKGGGHDLGSLWSVVAHGLGGTPSSLPRPPLWRGERGGDLGVGFSA